MSIVWPGVKGFIDGDELTAITLNEPVFKLAQRTDVLRRLLGDYMRDVNGNCVIRNIPLATHSTPGLYDAVILDGQGVAIKALQPLTLNERPAAGLLIETNGRTGTILLNGAIDVTQAELAQMLDNAPGAPVPVGYLSRIVAGKLTTVAPSNGYIICDIISRGGSYTLAVSPRPAANLGHRHESTAMYVTPVGSTVLTADDPSGVHKIHGYYPDSTDVAAIPVGEYAYYKPRLLLGGSWNKRVGATYTFWLSTQDGTDQGTSTHPTTWAQAYIHWETDNPELPGGSARLYSYGAPAAIGDTGITVALEPPVEAGPVDCDHSVPYQVAAGVTVADRTWTLSLPHAARGWAGRRIDTVLTSSEDLGFRVVAGGKFDTEATYHPREITVESLYSYLVDMTDLNGTWKSLTITTPDNQWKFLIGHSGSATTPGSRTITVEYDDDPEVTLRRLVAAAREILPASSGIRIIRALGDTDFIVASADANTTLDLVVNSTPSVIHLDAPDGTPGDLNALIAYDEHWTSVVATAYWDAGTAGSTGTEMVGGGRLYYVPATEASPVAPTATYKATARLDADAPLSPFVYMMGTHPTARGLYPPIPITAIRLELNGVLLDAYDGSGADYTYVAGADTLYWKADSWGAVPWPTYWTDHDSEVEPYARKKLRMHTSYGLLDTGVGVTSLRPAPNAPVKITRCGTDEAAVTGDLEVDVNFDATTTNSNEAGYNVIKRITGSRGYAGPVVERIIPGPGITIHQNYGAPAGQGIVTVGLAGQQDYAGEFDTIALENAKQAKIGMFSYIKLLGWDSTGPAQGNIKTGLTAQFRIPHTLANKQYGVIVYATVFGTNSTSGGGPTTFAGLEFSYSAVHDLFTAGGDMVGTNASLKSTPMVSSPTATAIQFDPGYVEYDPMIIHNAADEPDKGVHLQHVLGAAIPGDNPWPLRPGSIVAVRIARGGIGHMGGASEYKHPVGIVNLRWRLITLGE